MRVFRGANVLDERTQARGLEHHGRRNPALGCHVCRLWAQRRDPSDGTDVGAPYAEDRGRIVTFTPSPKCRMLGLPLARIATSADVAARQPSLVVVILDQPIDEAAQGTPAISPPQHDTAGLGDFALDWGRIPKQKGRDLSASAVAQPFAVVPIQPFGTARRVLLSEVVVLLSPRSPIVSLCHADSLDYPYHNARSHDLRATIQTGRCDPMRAIGYCRVSTEEQGESGLGLESQRDTIEREISRRGWTLDHMYTDVA